MTTPIYPLIADLPPQSKQRIALHIKPAAEKHLKQGHPWLFEDAIRQQNHDGDAGDIAVIFDRNNRFLAVGLYDPHSPIRVKVLQHNQPATINADFLHNRIASAIVHRRPLNQSDTNAYRLIHGENDSLPGLIVDRYAQTLVIKLYTAAWVPYLHTILDALTHLQPATSRILRLSRNIAPILAPLGLTDGALIDGDPITTPIQFLENGLHFQADVISGHKTGFFFDHRDNRQRTRNLTKNHRVLDVFAYSGGFSVYAAAGGASSVTSVDVSAPALEAARINMQLNTHLPDVAKCDHRIICEDAFTALQSLADDNQRFDVVIVDPPSFAKSAAEIDRALTAYRSLTRLALAVTESHGQLIMASCSSRVTASAFFDAVTHTALQLGHTLTNIDHTFHALDHPIGFPQGAYLKCLYART